MQVEKIFEGDDFYTVTGARIRGYDWKLIRKPGQGTYALIAGPSDDHPEDQEIVIEEYAAPDQRKIWDEMDPQKVAELAYETLTPDPLAFFHVPDSDDHDLFVVKNGRVFLISHEMDADVEYEEHDALPDGAEPILPHLLDDIYVPELP